MAAVELNGVSKSFGDTRVLERVSLAVRDGEFLTLVGPSGCGKSTLLRIIAGLEIQTTGSVTIGGRLVDDLSAKQRNLAMVFQSYALYPYMTIAQNIALPLKMRRLSRWHRLPLVARLHPRARTMRAGIDRDVRDAAATVGIDALLDRKPGQLSGGQRQRVALARAMVREPQVFLMDEPLSNLDAKLRVQMRAEIAELHQRLGTTFVYVTHDQAEAMTMSHRIAVMIEGEVAQIGSPGEVYSDPVDIRVASLIGSPAINLLPATVTGPREAEVLSTRLTFPRPIPLPLGKEVLIGVRPEAVDMPAGSADDALPSRITHVEHLGSDIFLNALLSDGRTRITARLEPVRGIGVRAGQLVRFSIDAGRALLFERSGARVRVEEAPMALQAVQR